MDDKAAAQLALRFRVYTRQFCFRCSLLLDAHRRRFTEIPEPQHERETNFAEAEKHVANFRTFKSRFLECFSRINVDARRELAQLTIDRDRLLLELRLCLNPEYDRDPTQTELYVFGDEYQRAKDLLDGIEGRQRVLCEMFPEDREKWRPAASEPNEIISLGDGCYKIGESSPIFLEKNDDDLLQPFLETPAMSSSMLIEASEQGLAPARLRRLRKKFDGLLAPAIEMPVKRGTGGYHVRIRKATTDKPA